MNTLTELLAYLYDTEANIRRIASDAGMRIDLIPFEGSAVSMWYAVLLQAERSLGATRAILARAKHEFPNRTSELDAAYQQVLITRMATDYIPQAGSNGRVDKLQDGFSDMRVQMAKVDAKLDGLGESVEELRVQLTMQRWFFIAYGTVIGAILIAMYALHYVG